MTFRDGSKVIYPRLGICRVVGVIEQSIGGTGVKFYSLKPVDHHDSTHILVPVDKAQDVGVRRLIDRTEIKVHQSPVDLMIKAIGTTFSLIVFPEGSRSIGPEIGEFKSGLYYLAKKRPDLELVPVHIDNMNRVLPRGEFLPVPLLSCITFGPPIWLEAGEPKAEFLERARLSVRRLKEI